MQVTEPQVQYVKPDLMPYGVLTRLTGASVCPSGYVLNKEGTNVDDYTPTISLLHGDTECIPL